MRRPIRWLRSRLRRVRSEAGDTLIEVLIATLVIGVGATALMAGFGTVIVASGEHRSLASIDTVLRSFAETAKFQVQQQVSPLFTNCATSYTLASLPTPTSGPPGTAVTVFGTGFTPGNTMSVTLTDTSTDVATVLPSQYVNGGQPVVVPSPPALNSGDVTVTFSIPPTGFVVGDSYTVTLSDGVSTGSISSTSTTPFSVTTGTPATTSALAGYTLEISQIQTWNPQATPSPAFELSPCAPSGIQLVTLSAIAPKSVTDTLNFVVINPAFVVQAFTPTVTVSASPTGAVATSSVTFTATVSGPTDAAAPTGSLAWSLSGPGSPSCPTSTLTPGSGNSSTATCTLQNAQASPPSYSATANYAGDTEYVAASGTGDLTIQGLTSELSVVPSPASPALNSTITFTATVTGPTGGPAPTGNVTWNLSGPGNPSCPNSALAPGSGNSSTATCVVSNVLAGSYAVAPLYAGDSYYVSASGSGAATVNPTAPSIAVTSPPNPTLGSTITFTATVSGPTGGPAPTGNVTWSLSGPGSPSCPTSTLTPGSGNSSTATCAVSNVSVGNYGAAANYPGDSNYATTNGTGTIAVTAATPTVNVVSSPTSPSPGSSFTFTATVAGPSAAPAPTGNLTWSLNGPGSPSCPTSTLTPGSANSSTATCSVTSTVTGTYTVSPSYGGDSNYAVVSGRGSVVVANPPLNVTSVASANFGGTAGQLAVGDTFSVTFSNALNPGTINQTAGATVITLVGSGSSTNITISGLSVPTGFTVGSVYESSGKSASANGTLSLSNSNKTVTFTVTSGSLGSSSHVQQGGAVTFTFVPNSAIEDANGTQPNPNGYLQATAIVLF